MSIFNKPCKQDRIHPRIFAIIDSCETEPQLRTCIRLAFPYYSLRNQRYILDYIYLAIHRRIAGELNTQCAICKDIGAEYGLTSSRFYDEAIKLFGIQSKLKRYK